VYYLAETENRIFKKKILETGRNSDLGNNQWKIPWIYLNYADLFSDQIWEEEKINFVHR
jgi:hypothetical protein